MFLFVKELPRSTQHGFAIIFITYTVYTIMGHTAYLPKVSKESSVNIDIYIASCICELNLNSQEIWNCWLAKMFFVCIFSYLKDFTCVLCY